MAKALSFVVMLGLACLLAGAYGAIHNQVSYSVGPDYFHHLKFEQFGISAQTAPRLGAALVGFAASWWMGIVIGLPLATLAMFIRGPARAVLRVFGLAAGLVVVVALVLGLLSLRLPITPEVAELVLVPATVEDPDGFRRAALLHSASYLAGIIGLFAGLIVVGVAVLRSRRQT